MRSSLAWCLEAQWCEPDYAARNKHIRKINPRGEFEHNFERVRREAPGLRVQGMSGAAIARKLGVSTNCVYRALQAEGVKLR